jgi:glycopeptide antibiotics resistance protein
MRQDEAKRISGKRIVLLIVTGLVIAFIFVQSLLPKSVSAGESGWLAEHVVNPLLRLFGVDLFGDHIARKIAHVAEFSVLAFLLTFCFRGQIAKSAGAGFLTAFLDESLQLLSDRGALISDVWIDLIGIAIGIMFGVLIRKAIRYYKKRRDERSASLS